jgi:hypothetical protein
MTVRTGRAAARFYRRRAVVSFVEPLGRLGVKQFGGRYLSLNERISTSITAKVRAVDEEGTRSFTCRSPRAPLNRGAREVRVFRHGGRQRVDVPAQECGGRAGRRRAASRPEPRTWQEPV